MFISTYNSSIMVGGNLSVALHTLGCKLNQAESEDLSLQLAAKGFQVTRQTAAAIHIVNTCTVTHIADRKARHLVRFLRQQNPAAVIVATGCYVQRAAVDLEKAGADLVIDNQHKDSLPDLLARRFESGMSMGHAAKCPSFNRRVRSFIKIQDGCGHFCSYCIVPLVRTSEVCARVGDIIQEINRRIALGYKEVVLTGTRIGSYRSGSVDLKELISLILAQTDIQRLHLSSLQPQEITPELLRLWPDNRLMRHFHLALQSGSPAVLKRMGRQYSLEEYRQAVKLIREIVPQSAITTDIMVGFPGEGQEEFLQSYNFCREMEFAAIHVFAYSPRPGTRAATMTHQVDAQIKKERSSKMLKLAQTSAAAFQQNFKDSSVEVLFEGEESPPGGIYSGFNQHYVRVYASGDHSLINSISTVKTLRRYRDGLWGVCLS